MHTCNSPDSLRRGSGPVPWSMAKQRPSTLSIGRRDVPSAWGPSCADMRLCFLVSCRHTGCLWAALLPPVACTARCWASGGADGLQDGQTGRQPPPTPPRPKNDLNQQAGHQEGPAAFAVHGCPTPVVPPGKALSVCHDYSLTVHTAAHALPACAPPDGGASAGAGAVVRAPARVGQK